MSCKSSSSGLLLVAILLGGCATAPARLPPAGGNEGPAAFSLNGRIGVHHGTEGFFGSLRWRHDRAADDLLLSSPLGQAVAHIERTAQGVVLDAADRHYVAPDAGDLTERVLGWRLPLDGMPYWVAGRAAPDGPASISRDEADGVVRLKQGGWNIEYRDYRPQGRYLLPSRVVLRNGSLELRLVVDQWMVP